MTVPFEHPTIVDRFRMAAAERRRRATTVFGTAFSPAPPATTNNDEGGVGGGAGGGRYLLGCSSFGTVCVWDAMRACSSSRNASTCRVGAVAWDGGAATEPLLSLDVTSGSGPLYDIDFVRFGDGGNSEPFLVASGRGGAFLYKWSDLQSEIERVVAAAAAAAASLGGGGGAAAPSVPAVANSNAKPRAALRVHPSPFGVGSVNRTSADATRRGGVLYGAADDGFGTYVWDVEREVVLGTLTGGGGGRGRGGGGGGSAPVHAVRSIDYPSNTVLTGGEGGTLDVWDGKELRLVQSIDCRSAMVGDDNDLSSSSKLVSADGGSNAALSGMGGLWVSSIEVAPESGGDWAAVGGGIDPPTGSGSAAAAAAAAASPRRAAAAAASSSSSSSHGGFVSLWHLPTRSLSSAYVTRESVQDVAYHPAAEKYVTVGNEGVVSYWGRSDLAAGRAGRAWTSTPSGYGVAVHDANGLMVVSGAGCTVDCFADLGNRSFGLSFR